MPLGQAILGLMYGDPADQISRTLNPVNPNPNPNPGAPPAPGAAPGGPQPPGGSGGPSGAPSSGPPPPQPPMAASNATQSPPDLASLYVQLHRQDQAAAGIDRGLQGMAASFGTAQQQHDMMEAMKGITPDDRGKMLGNIIDDQAAQKKAQDLNRFQAGAAGMSKILGDKYTPEMAQWAALNPDLFKELATTHARTEEEAARPTETMKNAEAETAQWKQSHPNATPQEVADHHASVLSGMMPGPAQAAAIDQAKAAQDFKDTAMTDYGSLNNTYSSNEDRVKQLLADMPSTMAALKDPEWMTRGTAAGLGLTGAWQSTKNQAALIDQLKASLTGDNLKNVKNVRNQREFDTLGRALTGALTGTNSEAQVRAALEDIQKKFLDAHATNEMAAGHHLTGNLVGHGQQDLLSPTLSNGQKNPFYNGATQDERPSGGGGGKTYTYNPKTGQLE